MRYLNVFLFLFLISGWYPAFRLFAQDNDIQPHVQTVSPAPSPADSITPAQNTGHTQAPVTAHTGYFTDATVQIAGTMKLDESAENGVLYDDPYLAEIDRKWQELIARSPLLEDVTVPVEMPPEADVQPENLTTAVLKQRLEELDAKTPFHITYNPDLERLIKTFLKTRKETLSKLLYKSRYFFPLFEEKLDKYGIPLEVKYLAIVESALRPGAVSRAGATGIWQFMFGTGRQYGLKVSSYVDERKDPVLSTEAACRYIADLYDIFGDWDLALAAYNSGPGNVTKAIRRSGGYRNYWNIRRYLPVETAGYLPIFYATLYLFEYAGEHGISPAGDYLPAYYQTDTVLVKRLISFEQISEKTGVDMELLRFLNPSYKLEMIPRPKDRMYPLVLPVEYTGIFVSNEQAIYDYAAAQEAKREKPLPKYAEINQRIRYRVRPGDYLGKIAGKFGVSVKSIKRWNGLKSSRIRAGQRLTIYPRRFPAAANTKNPAKKKTGKRKPLPEGDVISYTVQQGDSLWIIAQKYPGVSVQNLREWNGIWGDKLQPGTIIKLVVPEN